jgi:polysaccharide export outer membrane protein
MKRQPGQFGRHAPRTASLNGRRWLLPITAGLLLAAVGAGLIHSQSSVGNPAADTAEAVSDQVPAQETVRPVSISGNLAAARFLTAPDGSKRAVELCQFLAPQPRSLNGVDCQSWRTPHREPHWPAAHPVPWEEFGHGEYLGPARSPHVMQYPLRVDDLLDLVYRFTHEEIRGAYRLLVGDEIVVEQFPQDTPEAIRRGDINSGRGLVVQPDGTIVMPEIGPVTVVGRTFDEVEVELESRYRQYYKEPRFTVTPLKTNTRLEDLRTAVDARFGTGGQTRSALVSPDGTVQVVGLGSVPAQGLTLEELQSEINARYVELVGRGVEVTVTLQQRAPRFVWVVGEVNQPGQYELNQPVTVVQALALARGFINGGNVREIVVFRRDENWQLMATRLDVRGVFIGATPYPSDNIWLRDNDVVVIPKSPILRLDEFIDLVFTRGIYGVVPFSGVAVNFQKLSSI